jgi:tRNA-Thr(GGU) m(6)t(6)A37 methyltransferase TsaA
VLYPGNENPVSKKFKKAHKKIDFKKSSLFTNTLGEKELLNCSCNLLICKIWTDGYILMKDKTIHFQAIGTIHSSYKQPKGTPIQPAGAKGVEGNIVVNPVFSEGLQDLEEFSHIIVLYYFHLSKSYSLKVKPFMDVTEHGVFATRASARPNPIGLSILKLKSIEKNILHVSDVDIVDGTPLLDIKPYVPPFDNTENVRVGWLEKNVYKLSDTVDDERFL